ncbi:hypothetical protein N9U55_03045 [Luminiphilus sp.]|nr:hypothetical protein [Luminiphilus sp.]MDA9722244.1 hypothetical protein [Luminiphilus sp.]
MSDISKRFSGIALRASLISLFFGAVSLSAATETWFDADYDTTKSFLEASVHTQSRVFATCAVAHEFTALIEASEGASAGSAESEQLVNGSKLASAIVFVFDLFGQKSTPSPQQFQATWGMAKVAMESNYTTISTSVMAKLERDTENTLKEFMPTYKHCLDLRDEQQTQVNFWREILGSGLVTTP